MPDMSGTGCCNLLSHDLWQTKMGSVCSSLVESPMSTRVGSFMGPPGIDLSFNFMRGIRLPYTTFVCYQCICHPVTRVMQKVLSLIGFLSFIPGIF